MASLRNYCLLFRLIQALYRVRYSVCVYTRARVLVCLCVCICMYIYVIADIKKHVVRKIYERCDEVSSIYVKTHPEDWLLGGENAILIVDEFPGGYMMEYQLDVNSAKKRNNNSHTIICIAEASGVSPRIWLHMIEAVPEVIF